MLKLSERLHGNLNQLKMKNQASWQNRKKLPGLFPNLTSEKTRKGPDARDVPVGTILPFGKVARVCEAKDQGALGHLLDRSTATGRGHKLFDSAPQSVGARTFYVTGFKDNCPHQFTASLALFGSAEVQK